MSDSASEIRTRLLEQGHLVLATSGPDGPRASLMAFALHRDGRTLFLATRRDSRKFRNMLSDSRVSLLLDDRSLGRPLSLTHALTLCGTVRLLQDAEADLARQALAARHGHLSAILAHPDTALLAVDIRDGLLLSGPDQATPLP